MSLDTPQPATHRHAVLSGREDLAPRPRECLLCYLDRQLASHDCADDHQLVTWWRSHRAPRATTLARRLTQMGAHCDCEVLTAAYEPVEGLIPLDMTGWHRPACSGVTAGSSQPCARWRRRTRWE